MINWDQKVRYALLKPLARRRPNTADQKAVIQALERLDNYALGVELLSQLREVIKTAKQDKRSGRWKDPDYVKKSVALAHALYMARRCSKEEYVFFAAFPVENLFDSRLSDGVFNGELGPINQAIDKIREERGLGPDEYWKVGEGPKDYQKLNDQWEAIYNKHFMETFREFGLNDLAELIEKKPTEFKRLRERGRRSLSHRDEIELAIRDIVVRFERDSRRAAEAKAYSAAVTSLGAALEGLLLLRCLRSKHKALRVAKKLPRKKRPRFLEDFTTWTFDNLIEVCLAAEWLPSVSTSYAEYNSAGLAHLLRAMRNYIHPGRHVKEKPWLEIDERDYNDAHAIYVILLSKIGGGKRQKKKVDSNNGGRGTTYSARHP